MTNHTLIDAEFIWEGFKLYSSIKRPSYRTGLAENRTPVEKTLIKTPFFGRICPIEGVNNKLET